MVPCPWQTGHGSDTTNGPSLVAATGSLLSYCAAALPRDASIRLLISRRSRRGVGWPETQFHLTTEFRRSEAVALNDLSCVGQVDNPWHTGLFFGGSEHYLKDFEFIGFLLCAVILKDIIETCMEAIIYHVTHYFVFKGFHI